MSEWTSYRQCSNSFSPQAMHRCTPACRDNKAPPTGIKWSVLTRKHNKGPLVVSTKDWRDYSKDKKGKKGKKGENDRKEEGHERRRDHKDKHKLSRR